MFLLHSIKGIFKGEVGLYRDDGLAILRNHSASEANRVAKLLIAKFKEHGLKITIDQGLKVVNFLDVTFNLNDGTYRPYMKPNNQTVYVNRRSNHPGNVIKAVPSSVNKRLSNISSDANQFSESIHPYQNALNDAGYEHQLKFEPNSHNHTKRNRNRNIIWFNPPFSKHVKTNVGRKFLQLIDKHFPRDSILHKIFNRNNVKMSYSCMDNMGKIINAHNKSILRESDPAPSKTCNCRKPTDCPLSGNCLTKSIIYEATVSSNQGNKTYVGLCETEFKLRYNNHKSTFKLEQKRNSTSLSKHIWELKDAKSDFTVKWKILKKCQSYSNISKRCQLCLWEKYFIITANKPTNLNSRSELISKCRHAKKYLLMSII